MWLNCWSNVVQTLTRWRGEYWRSSSRPRRDCSPSYLKGMEEYPADPTRSWCWRQRGRSHGSKADAEDVFNWRWGFNVRCGGERGWLVMSTFRDTWHWESIWNAANPDHWLYHDACIDTSLVLRLWDDDSSNRLEPKFFGPRRANIKMKLNLRVLKGYHEKIVFVPMQPISDKTAWAVSFKTSLSSNRDQHFREISCGTIIQIRLRHTP